MVITHKTLTYLLDILVKHFQSENVYVSNVNIEL